MSHDCLVTVKEAARAIGISRGSLYRMVRAHRVPVYSAGPKLTGLRFSIPELREALRRRGGNGEDRRLIEKPKAG